MYMGQKLENIIWMGEELDFELNQVQAIQARELMGEFLVSAGGEGLNHIVTAPSDNLPVLRDKLQTAHSDEGFSAVIDLTRGKLLHMLNGTLTGIPTWTDLSVSRVRQATKPKLPTSGHIVSHAPEDIKKELQQVDTSNVLVLDDTSFSGNTSLIVERRAKLLGDTALNN